MEEGFKNQTTLIFGRTGQGKSTLAASLVQDSKRLIIVDTLGEYGVSSSMSTDEIPLPHLAIIGDVLSLIAYLKKHPRNFRISFRPGWMESGAFQAGWDTKTQVAGACHAAFIMGCCDLLVEELDFYCKGNYVIPQLENIVRYGRHKNIRMIAVVRRAFSMPILIRSQAKEVYTFQQVEPRDLDYMRAWLGDERASLIRELPDHSYLHLTI